MKFLLPCSCGKSIPVEVSQAGQMVTCSCGDQLEVPAMRRIRQLKPAETQADMHAKPSRQWSAASRILFVIGVAAFVWGVVKATDLQVFRSQLPTEEVTWDHTLDADLSGISSMSLGAAWDFWEAVRDSGIGPYHPPEFIKFRWLSTDLKTAVVIWLALALAGLIMICTAWALPRETAPRYTGRRR